MRRFFMIWFTVSLPTAASAQEGGGDSAAEMARRLQERLANIAAITTDNDIL